MRSNQLLTYDLRHFFISLLIHEGLGVIEIARQAGHSPHMTLNTYAHVFDEYALAGRGSAEEEILKARGDDVPVCTLLRRRIWRRMQIPCKQTVGGARLERATSCL